MKRFAPLLIFLMAQSAAAHGPTPQKTDESIIVKASVDTIWKNLTDLCGIATWHPDVAACVSSAPNKRTLTLKSGGMVNEEFDEILDVEKSISYRIAGEVDIKAIAVSSLNGRIQVSQDGDQSKVTWKARYYRVFTGNEPPPGQDDEAAMLAINQYISKALQGLKERIEK